MFTSATELEFWVKTPLEKAAIKEMSASQVLQEQCWERMHGAVRCALEKCVIALDEYLSGIGAAYLNKRCSLSVRFRLEQNNQSDAAYES